jgi:hypothetical protein
VQKIIRYAKRRPQSGDASKYISNRPIRQGEPVVLWCRASNIEQERVDSLKRHRDWMYQQMLDCGAVIVGEVSIVASGFDPIWIGRAVAIAEKHNVAIVAHSTDRFVRHSRYSKTNQKVRAGETELKEITRYANGIELITLIDPNAKSSEIRKAATERGIAMSQAGWKKQLRLHRQPFAKKLRQEGCHGVR